MPETKAWSGEAHNAATAMFQRAEARTGEFSRYASAVAAALTEGATAIGSARTALLNKVDSIESGGQLYVNEQWVVLITGAPMTAEQAADLERRAQAEQTAVNTLLVDVGAADDNTASKIMNAARPHGFEAPDPHDLGSLMTGQTQQPPNEVPDPLNPLGLLQQAAIRDADMTTTVRETTERKIYNQETGEEIATEITLYMQDGSKTVRTVYNKPDFPDRTPKTVEERFDKNGNKVWTVSSLKWHESKNPALRDPLDGAATTVIEFSNGTSVEFIFWPDDRPPSIYVHDPSGIQQDIPLNLLNHPVLNTASAGFSGLEKYAEKGIPFLSSDISKKVQVGAKYGGPGIAIATALWDIAAADNGFQRCVATAEAVGSLTAGTIAGLLGLPTGPATAFALSLLTSAGGQAIGNWVGNTFCPR
ncbi:hypothetical protein C731_2319 [Mycolicibacterium hassiacum DSM 44199]|uniref:Uncharacterized protein n=1 Tax=Mycolicibacterium hassiacum (strain DSM 44199 / CIP 105218 / JCM 12690 / 3849) TaxID=1122247 RepID=K5BBB4_MYCHD|nr:hypothetical protein [Mycolicibacterium hassiacum]EKF23695.1 hypothetical protein C731_2319 [Mycolicibacterium hassiacum DSM 44199]MDA4088683.1 hypothetical protein [Mycolicibacterium hassiacum DSM 44199]